MNSEFAHDLDRAVGRYAIGARHCGEADEPGLIEPVDLPRRKFSRPLGSARRDRRADGLVLTALGYAPAPCNLENRRAVVQTLGEPRLTLAFVQPRLLPRRRKAIAAASGRQAC